ncbi:MAG: type IV toxin-antitoxin system AbiEi family antitoxin domain-containing protein [Myxococcales bacterium]|nr:type IV toxin-antitoxin system AbiEi family antitoxin domain-containing protein [Myxococcales bacterium]
MVDGAETATLRVAARQYGVIRRDQAEAHGLSGRQIERRVESGQLVRVLPRVYRVEGAPQTWRQQLKAASLWAERDFAVSHRSAAALWGFARFPEGALELSLVRSARLHAPVILHRVDPLSHRELVSIDGFRVTSAARTLLDLGASEPEPDVQACFDEALRRRWVTLERMEAALGGAPRRHGTAFLRRLVHEYLGGDGPTESELEARVMELLDTAGLPRAERQRVVRVGGRLRRLDFLVPGTPIVIEADGYAVHASLGSFEKDRARNNALTAHGFRVLHWTWSALHERPDELLQELLLTLRALAQPG